VAQRSTGSNSSDEGINQKVDRSAFLQVLGAKGFLFLERMFILFDRDRDGLISFGDYLSGLSVLCARGTLEEKVRFAFEIYDIDGDGKISREDLSAMLIKSFTENDIKITPKQVKSIIDSTFVEGDKNKDNFIDLGEFKVLTDNHRSLLSNMTLDFKGIIDTKRQEI